MKRDTTAHGLTGARRSIRPFLLQTILAIGHINHTRLPQPQEKPDFRPKIYRNRYGSAYPLARAGANPA
ncbi:MAG: hypothetical protein HY766_12750 [candidate division NC10 bacterium]|nr:hypothetical protein [candidate division NC10 bacterium]